LARAHGFKATDPIRVLEQVRARQSTQGDQFLSAFAVRIADVLTAPVAVVDPELIIPPSSMALWMRP
jgi:hypothetical protein